MDKLPNDHNSESLKVSREEFVMDSLRLTPVIGTNDKLDVLNTQESSDSDEDGHGLGDNGSIASLKTSGVKRKREHKPSKFKTRTELPVECWTVDGTRLLRLFPTVKAAIEVLLIPHAKLVMDCCSGDVPDAFGFKWRLIEMESFNHAHSIISEEIPNEVYSYMQFVSYHYNELIISRVGTSFPSKSSSGRLVIAYPRPTCRML
jgi:hypothetical protein